MRARGLKPYPDYLTRSGYRLPTEAEWEYACRAGSVTAYPFGASEEYLPHYVRYNVPIKGGGMCPVSTLKPNDLGLFGVLGNAIEWCQDGYGPYPAEPPGGAAADAGGGEVLPRVLRGGSYLNPPSLVRSATRQSIYAISPVDTAGFRVARTLPGPAATRP